MTPHTELAMQPRQATAIEAFGADHAKRCLEAERTILAAGWFDEVELNDAAFLAGLRYEHFLDPANAFQFGYLCQSADEGLETSALQCAAIAKAARIALTVDDIDATIWGTDAYPCDLDHYARTVRRLARQRERVSHCIRSIGEIVGDYSDRLIENQLSTKRPTGLMMPDRVRRAWRRKHHVRVAV